MNKYVALFFALLLAGCATQRDYVRVGFDRVSATPESYYGTSVFWSGLVRSVRHDGEASWIDVREHSRFNDLGRPDPRIQSKGRFLARVKGNVDPTIAGIGWGISVVGPVRENDITGGEHGQPELLVEATRYRLWAPSTLDLERLRAGVRLLTH